MGQTATVGHLGQQHVLHQGMVQPRVAAPVTVPAATLALGLLALVQHFAQHAAQARRVARPLQGAGIGQPFALARDGRFEQLAAEPPNPARRHDGAAKPAAQNAGLIAQGSAKVVNQLQPIDHAHQVHIEVGIALFQVGQLMRHQSLELIAGQVIQRPLGDGNDRILGRPTGGKGIDGIGAGQHHHLRRLHVGSNTHFLHGIDQLALGQIALGLRWPRPHQQGQFAAPATHRVMLHPPAAQDEKQRHPHIRQHKTPWVRPAVKQQPPRQSQPQMHGGQAQQHTHKKAQQQATRALAGRVLGIPKAGGARHG